MTTYFNCRNPDGSTFVAFEENGTWFTPGPSMPISDRFDKTMIVEECDKYEVMGTAIRELLDELEADPTTNRMWLQQARAHFDQFMTNINLAAPLK